LAIIGDPRCDMAAKYLVPGLAVCQALQSTFKFFRLSRGFFARKSVGPCLGKERHQDAHIFSLFPAPANPPNVWAPWEKSGLQIAPMDAILCGCHGHADDCKSCSCGSSKHTAPGNHEARIFGYCMERPIHQSKFISCISPSFHGSGRGRTPGEMST
jgi:hypothetical protein